MTTSALQSADTPELIGVLDLKDGQVVHAVAGKRDEYRPLSLSNGDADVVHVAQAIADANAIGRFYVADLDGLQGRPPQTKIIARLAERFSIVLDGGFRSPTDLAASASDGRIRPIIALESWTSPKLLAEAAANCPLVVFSLDLVNGQPRYAGSDWPNDCQEIVALAVAAGVTTILVLDVSTVGRSRGLANSGLCREIRRVFPTVNLWTGGGLTLAASEIATAASLGMEALLIGTEFYKQAGLKAV